MSPMRDYSGGPVIKTAILMQGTQVQSPVGELRAYMSVGAAKKNKRMSLMKQQ